MMPVETVRIVLQGRLDPACGTLGSGGTTVSHENAVAPVLEHRPVDLFEDIKADFDVVVRPRHLK
jgi:hypothetical protein